MRRERYLLRGRCLLLAGALFLSGLLYSSCRGHGADRALDAPITEGVVDYRLKWEGALVDPMLRSVLPTTMRIYFREPMVRTEMRSMGGLASVVSLVNTQSGECHVLVTVVGVKSHYQEEVSRNQLSLLFKSDYMLHFPDAHQRDTAYLGFYCQAIDSMLGEEASDVFQLFFAPQIGWRGMNSHSPFQGVEGAVLKGRIVLAGTYLDVEAVAVTPEQLHDSLFVIPSGYRDIDRVALMQLLGLDLSKS